MRCPTIFICLLLTCCAAPVFTANATSKAETLKHQIFSVCDYYDNNGLSYKGEECNNCFKGVFGDEETPQMDPLKECIGTLPTRFTNSLESNDVVKALVTEILIWREEERQVFAQNYKDVLSFKDIEKLSQIVASFVMASTMSVDLTNKTFNDVVNPIYKCIAPGVDLKTFDNEVMNEEDADNMLISDEDKMMAKGNKIPRSADEEAPIRVRVTNMYKRTYKIFVCCINRIGEDKTASGIVKDYLKTYYGVVPAKVARDACKW